MDNTSQHDPGATSVRAPARLLVFFIGAALVTLASWLIVHSRSFLGHENVLSVSLTIDMVLILPLLYYLLIRRTSIPPFSIAIIFLGSLTLATVIIPGDQQDLLAVLKVLPIPVELAVMVWLVYTTRKVVAKQRSAISSGKDFVDSLREILADTLQNVRVANIFTTEISLFYFALAGWNRPSNHESECSFSYHRKSGYAAIAWAFTLIIVVETVALHYVLSIWTPVAAWIATGLSLYSMVFLIGDLNAIRQRPIIIDDQSLHVRVGIRWSLSIPLSEIESVTSLGPTEHLPDVPALRVIGEPNLLLRCRSDHRADGLYGMTKTIRSVRIFVDDEKAFIRLFLPETGMEMDV